jgi:hypothetical protein
MYNETNFFDNYFASTKPSDINMFSQIKTRSGTTMAHDLNKAFKLSGNYALPA